MYADDTQLCAVIRPEEHDVGLQKLQQCKADVKEWSLQNNLQLNDSKTEVIHVFSRFRGARILPVLQIGDGTSIACVQASRDLGVILDKNLTMAYHIRSKSRAAAFGISKIGKLVQIEYALNAVAAGAPSVGIKASNGVVIATEKKHKSVLYEEPECRASTKWKRPSPKKPVWCIRAGQTIR
eukprot:XP_011668828.1 PREDICTED: uncharacterized protein LOC100888850 [Strongylocentrotus purpuratus]